MSRPLLIGVAAAALLTAPLMAKPAAPKPPAQKTASEKPAAKAAKPAAKADKPAAKKPAARAAKAPAPKAAPAATPANVPIPTPAPDRGAVASTSPAIGAPAAAEATPAKRAFDAFTAVETTSAIPLQNRSAPTSSEELSAVREALTNFKSGALGDALSYRASVRDPGAVALIDWLAIRYASRQVGFARLEWFLRSHPDWPGASGIRRRAEEALWLEDIEPARVRTFFGGSRPITEEGKLAIARALLVGGDPTGAAAWVRDAWRSEVTSPEFERAMFDRFGAMLTPADHKHRAELLFFAERIDQALKVAEHAGGSYPAIARARAAVLRRSKDAEALLKAVPDSARREPAYIFALAQYYRRNDQPKQAAAVMNTAPRDPAALVDPDEWWTERRIIARELIEAGDPRAAYQICRDHAATKPEAKAEAEFHAGWLALRFLKDPSAAARHFAALDQVASTALSKSRAGYWLGRAAEAAGDTGRARAHYEAAARHSTTYYGQLARTKLGGRDLPLRSLPQPTAEDRVVFERLPAARAVRILYALGERELAMSLSAGLAESLDSPGQLALLADLAVQQRDVRTMLVVGKTAVSRGLPFELVAYPTNGIPSFVRREPAVETPVVYAIARQESAFNPAAVSHAGARGLLQLMPATAQRTAKSVGLPFDARRLTSDPAYNAALGAAHLGHLVDNYNGSYVMTFAAYNAGPGRVKEWVARYGDPRTGAIDPVDWVELIPFTETRNYVQRVMENVQVYRARLTARSGLMIEADLRRGGS